MRKVRYSVAASLDGFIAGPKGEYDWIPMDPDIDFDTMFVRYDTALIGRRTFEVAGGGDEKMSGMETYVFSDTLSPDDYDQVTIVRRAETAEIVGALRASEGKDIWLFGGGLLFRSLLDQGLVDAVEVAVIPILLGEGIPLLPPPAPRAVLGLVRQEVYGKTGTVWLEYEVSPRA